MNDLLKLAILAGTTLALTACGGDDVAQALNLGAPQARFANAVQGSQTLALYRKGDPQTSAGTQSYEGASKYFDTVNATSTWDVRDAAAGTELGTTSMRVENATRYTIVALPGSGTMYNLLQISDPYDNALTSNARVRISSRATPSKARWMSTSPRLAPTSPARRRRWRPSPARRRVLQERRRPPTARAS